ncbi:choloylglycine hydrolase [Paenibacillus sp. 481]|nr:choloylglycine hydrolase [Paenibacillus sp. 481]
MNCGPTEHSEQHDHSVEADLPQHAKESVQGYFVQLQGSSYEVGRQQALFVKRYPHLLHSLLAPPQQRVGTSWQEHAQLLDTYCAGLNEELAGFCEELQLSPAQLHYVDSTWLTTGCSICAVQPAKMIDKRPYLLRNYDLAPQMDDMRLCSTAVTGLYRHTGFSTAFFGRSEGMNEWGLAVAFASCGMPVGNYPGLKQPQATGLQFWAVVRSLLERCRDTAEALALIDEMPIASNMNLIVMDRTGATAFIETVDGARAVSVLEPDSSGQGYTAATNHAVLPTIQSLDPRRLQHSVIRYNQINAHMEQHPKLTKAQLRQLVETSYPEGLTVHNYKEWFGTIRSMLFDLEAQELNVCFGSPLLNEWHTLEVGGTLPFEQIAVKVKDEAYGPQFWQPM